MPLYDILNEFQKGGSHMAAVTKAKTRRSAINKSCSMNGEADVEKGEFYAGQHVEESGEDCEDLSDGEVLGIITMEDVMEELLQVRIPLNPKP